MQPWENQFVELLSLANKVTPDMTDEEFDRFLKSPKALSEWKLAERTLRHLPVTELRHEIKRRIKALGGGKVLNYILRYKYTFVIRLRMGMTPFKEFKERAATDPVLRFFFFTHRSPKKPKHKRKRAAQIV